MRLKRFLQARFINLLAKGLFNAVTLDDIIQLKPDGVYLNEKKMTREEIEFVKVEAEKFKDSFLWKRLMKNRVKIVANRRLYETAIDADGLIFGKAMLYNLEILEKFLEALSKLK